MELQEMIFPGECVSFSHEGEGGGDHSIRRGFCGCTHKVQSKTGTKWLVLGVIPIKFKRFVGFDFDFGHFVV
jgi:hypothetical protein